MKTDPGMFCFHLQRPQGKLRPLFFSALCELSEGGVSPAGPAGNWGEVLEATGPAEVTDRS